MIKPINLIKILNSNNNRIKNQSHDKNNDYN